MGNLLLTSASGDDVDLGEHGNSIPDGLERRVITFDVGDLSEHVEGAAEYVRSCRFLDTGLPTRENTMCEYLVDRFFEGVKERGDFDEVGLIRLNPGKTILIEGRMYHFDDHGEKVVVYDVKDGREVTRIPRVGQVRKGGEKHVIVTLPTIGKNVKIKSAHTRVNEARIFLGHFLQGYTLSPMIAFPSDRLGLLVDEEKFNSDMPEGAVGPNYLEYFLGKDPDNLLLLFSSTSSELKTFTEDVYTRAYTRR